MSHPEYHGTQEAVDEFLTVGIDLAVKAAHQRRVSRFQREEAARTLGRDAWRAEHAKQNLDRLTASAKCAAVHNDEWWQRATPSQIVDAYRDAKTYEHEDPTATSALVRITAEIRDRFGIDAAALERADAPAEQLERLYAEHLSRSAVTTTGERLGSSPLTGDLGTEGEVLTGVRDYLVSRSLADVGSVGSIQDVAAMSVTAAPPQTRRTRETPGHGHERDRGR